MVLKYKMGMRYCGFNIKRGQLSLSHAYADHWRKRNPSFSKERIKRLRTTGSSSFRPCVKF